MAEKVDKIQFNKKEDYGISFDMDPKEKEVYLIEFARVFADFGAMAAWFNNPDICPSDKAAEIYRLHNALDSLALLDRHLCIARATDIEIAEALTLPF